MDSFEIFFLLGGEFGIQQNAAQADDTVQRCTQFVTDGGNKRRFVAAGAFKRILIRLRSVCRDQSPSNRDVYPRGRSTALYGFQAGFAPVRVIQPLFIGQ